MSDSFVSKVTNYYWKNPSLNLDELIFKEKQAKVQRVELWKEIKSLRSQLEENNIKNIKLQLTHTNLIIQMITFTTSINIILHIINIYSHQIIKLLLYQSYIFFYNSLFNMQLVIVRHGESEWNKLNLFTGFKDVDLTPDGVLEAQNCFNKLYGNFDIAFTSNLLRANKTCNIIKNTLEQEFNIIKSSALNERNYGDLTGQNKKEVVKKFGEEQVQLWRRSVNVKPPNGENLLDVINRVSEFFYNKIKPELDNNKKVLIVAHGNSIRALLVILQVFSIDVINHFEIPTAKPMFIYYPNITNYCFMNDYQIHGRQILDSRGNPTIEVDLLQNKKLIGRGTSPSGASTGSNEAIELRDGNLHLFMGKSIFNALNNINILNTKMYLDVKTIKNLKICDAQLMFLDGTELKTKLGGNTTTAVSFLLADAGANLSNLELFKHLANIYEYTNKFSMPIPMVNILNGGKHAGGKLKIQEFMIMPTDKVSFAKRTEYVFNIYHNLKNLLKKKYGPSSTNLGRFCS